MTDILNFEETENTEIVEVNNGVLAINENFMNTMSAYYVAKVEFENREKELKAALKKAMQENGIKSFKNDKVTITLKDGYERDQVDTQKMQDDGIYDQYVKPVKVAESVQIRWKA